MAGIGGIACTFVKTPEVRNLQERGEVWQVPGVDGYGAFRLGRGESGFLFEATAYCVNAAAAQAWYASLCLLAMTVVTIVDDWATSYANCIIHQVGPLAKQARVNTDGNGACIARCTISGVVMG